MEYFIQADFKVGHYYPLPEGMTLCDFQNHKIVKSYNVKWDTLHIWYGNNTQTEVNPIKVKSRTALTFLKDLKFFSNQ